MQGAERDLMEMCERALKKSYTTVSELDCCYAVSRVRAGKSDGSVESHRNGMFAFIGILPTSDFRLPTFLLHSLRRHDPVQVRGFPRCCTCSGGVSGPSGPPRGIAGA